MEHISGVPGDENKFRSRVGSIRSDPSGRSAAETTLLATTPPMVPESSRKVMGQMVRPPDGWRMADGFPPPTSSAEMNWWLGSRKSCLESIKFHRKLAWSCCSPIKQQGLQVPIQTTIGGKSYNSLAANHRWKSPDPKVDGIGNE